VRSLAEDQDFAIIGDVDEPPFLLCYRRKLSQKRGPRAVRRAATAVEAADVYGQGSTKSPAGLAPGATAQRDEGPRSAMTAQL